MRFALMLGCLVPSRVPQIEVSCRKVFEALGVTFEEPDFSCCPNTPYVKPVDVKAWILLAARNLALVEETGLTLVSPCPGCTSTLIEAKHELEDRELRSWVNERLKDIGKEYKGTAQVKHMLQALVEDIGFEKVKGIVKEPLGIKVAAHYGCHLLKPSEKVGFENPFTAHSLEDLVTALGGTPVDYENRDMCCGMVLGSVDQDGSLSLAHQKLESAHDAGAQAMVVTCPTCFLQFDMGQLRTKRKYSAKYNIPVFDLSQLIGLASGMTGKEIGIQMHKTKATFVRNP
jgi:heterodisulfide reductase subunit B